MKLSALFGVVALKMYCITPSVQRDYYAMLSITQVWFCAS